MNPTLRMFALLLVLGGLALGQGGGGAQKGKAGQAATDAAKKSLLSGPGYVQKEFLKGLKEELGNEFGDAKAERLFGRFSGKSVDAKDMLDLMNGKTTTSELEDLFETGKGDTERVEEAVDKCVRKKDKKLLFGILLLLMIMEFDIDASGEFCQQTGAAREEISDDSLGKIKRGNCSNQTIEESFGFENEMDCELMQEILKMLLSSPMLGHPMCESLGMGGKQKFDPKKCPGLEEGMPGSEAEFASGEAGGFPFDKEMPPCPFAGENAEKLFPTGEAEATR